MKALYLVNRADAQSVPFEAGQRVAQSCDLRIGSFYDGGVFPDGLALKTFLELGAKHPFDFSAVRRLANLIRSERPDLVHVHHTASAMWGVVLSRMFGVPAVIKSEHNDHRFQPFYRTLVNLLIFPLCDRILCNSDHTMRSFSQWEKRAARQRVTTVHNGVDVSRILTHQDKGAALRSELGLGGAEFLLGAIGRLVEQKNLAMLLDAMATLEDQGDLQVRLVIVGDGPLRAKLQSKTRQLGLDERVTFVGAVERERVYEFLSALDGLAVPSLWEGFCNAAVEALAGGVPVVAADIETLREVLDDCAIFADPSSPAALAEGIGALVRMTPKQRAGMAERGRALVRARYTLDATAGAYLEHYVSVLAARKKSGAPVGTQ